MGVLLIVRLDIYFSRVPVLASAMKTLRVMSSGYPADASFEVSLKCWTHFCRNKVMLLGAEIVVEGSTVAAC